MSITRIDKDIEAGTMVIVSEYPVPVEQVWELWANPRLLERWWGPPSHPATVTSHDLSPGGLIHYYMTGPDGEQYHGGWRIISTQPPQRLEFQDYFADTEGNENTSHPVSTTIVTITKQDDGISQMVIDSRYPTPQALEQAIEMGMEEGIKAALSQTNALLSQPHSIRSAGRS